MKLEAHVFGRPGRINGPLEQALASWLKTAVALAPKKWTKAVPFEISLACKGLESLRPAQALQELPAAPVALRIALPCKTPSLFAFPRSIVQALVAGLLGDVTGIAPADGELSSVEASLFQYFIEEYLLPALEETSPLADPIALAVLQLEPHPQWSRAFLDMDNLVVCTFTIAGPFGEHMCQWLIPAGGLVSLVGKIGADAQVPQAPLLCQPAPNIEELVHDLPVEIAVVLGRADVSLTQLAKLVEGDMVILDQRVSEPLSASIGGQDKYKGWAGRIGTLQAFQIQSLTGTR